MRSFIIILAPLIFISTVFAIDPKIHGGNSANDGQFPYQVSIRRMGYQSCGGAIINKQWIITTASCVIDLIPYPDNLQIFLGSTNLHSGAEQYITEKIIVHEKFNYNNFHNDIALVKLTKEITFASKTKPIPISKETVNENIDLFFTGWGLTSSDETSNNLQFITLKSITNKDCLEKLPGFPDAAKETNEDLIVSTQICTLTSKGKGVCFGDYGGPLVWNGKLIGLASWGYKCGNGYPDVFTRVSEYIEWIILNMV